MGRRHVGVALLAVLLFLPGKLSASALFDFSVGVKGGGGVEVWSEPSAQPLWVNTLPLYNDTRVGWSYGGGIFAEVRFLRFLGLEVDLLFFRQVLTETTTWNRGAGKTEERIEWTSLRIPILVKGVLPLGPVRLWLGVGPEFSIGLKADAEMKVIRGVTGDLPTFTARTVTDTYLALALGINIAVGPLSIPIDLRWSYNTSQPEAYDDRIVATIDDRRRLVGVRMRAASNMDARLLVGLAYEF
jgi:hypothetical protein